jgi:two-component system CheB/CheR fusion protein
MLIEPGHLYHLPADISLSTSDGVLQLCYLQSSHHVFCTSFLQSLSDTYGRRAVVVSLAGSRAIGRQGLAAIKKNRGLIIMQGPDEALNSNFPKEAVRPELVDLVLPLKRIPAAIAEYGERLLSTITEDIPITDRMHEDWYAIRDLMQSRLTRDITSTETPALHRVIRRRMEAGPAEAINVDQYLEILRTDRGELDQLENDFLAEITTAERDEKVVSPLVDATNNSTSTKVSKWLRQESLSKQQDALAELCCRLVLMNYTPAAILINRWHECVHATGPIDRYLRVSPGSRPFNLFSVVRQDIRAKLRSGIRLARQGNTRAVVNAQRLTHDGRMVSVSIAVEPVANKGEDLLLICFADDFQQGQQNNETPEPTNQPRALQRLQETRLELAAVIRNREISGEAQRWMSADARTDDEKHHWTKQDLFPSTNGVETSGAEFNLPTGQLQDALEQSRDPLHDSQHLLFSTNIPTLFLDSDCRICFFTPSAKSLFNMLPSDIGRPVAELILLPGDSSFLTDAHAVISTATAIEREIETTDGAWYMRRIQPYLTQDGGANGVDANSIGSGRIKAGGIVITFFDVSGQKRLEKTLEDGKRQAERATRAKSRFLAAASHELRQPLQTLALLQGSLANLVKSPEARRLVARLDDTLGAMSGVLNTLLDINQIEAGVVDVDVSRFPVNDLLNDLRDEFDYLANASQHELRILPCSLWIYSDRQLLAYMVRNLLSNASKYSPRGKLLLGCRRHGQTLSIEVWDNGIGIPETELNAIFEEYHQVDTRARNRSRGLGLGLAIVKRLGDLMNHPIRVHSRLGQGSAFSIEVPIAPPDASLPETIFGESHADEPRRAGSVLLIEDDPEVRESLSQFLKDEGHQVMVAFDSLEALERITRGSARPDLILADYNFSRGSNGLQLATQLRRSFRATIPVIILTGDISIEIPHDVSFQNCVKLTKPISTKDLGRIIQRLIRAAADSVPSRSRRQIDSHRGAAPIVYIVDDDDDIRAGMRSTLEDDGRVVEDYESCEAFMAAYRSERPGCLLVDAYLPGMSGLDLLRRLQSEGHRLPSIMITGNSDVPIAVQAMKAGAVDFIEKPVGRLDLLASIDRALEPSKDTSRRHIWREAAARYIGDLTSRQREIMEMVLAGKPSKIIASELRISQRTVEGHRAAIMKKTGCKSLPALARLALAATSGTLD